MKQIIEAVQAIESAIGFWWPSWILLKKLEKKNYQEDSLGPYAYSCTANIWK